MAELPDYLGIMRNFDKNSKPVKGYETADDVIRAIYSGTFKGSCLLPVMPDYQDILGNAVWVCANEQQAARKRRTEPELVFAVNEFKLIVETAEKGVDGLRRVINTKRTFGGVIGVA